MKWLGKILIFLTMFLCSNQASAGVVFTEIMYDVSGTDTDREWVEIYNAGEESVDISKYKFFESSANHALSLFEGEAILPKGGYAVIASNPIKFKIDWPFFTGALFDSSFSLSNEGESLSMKDENLAVTDDVLYDTSLGAGGDGKSLSINTTWAVSTPTPGKPNEGSTDNNEAQNISATTSVTSSSNSVSAPTAKSIYIDLSAEEPVIVGAPVHFEVAVFGVNDEKLVYGKLVWNFGDGSTLTTPLYGDNQITHTYFYSGAYIVTVEYFAGEYLNKPNAQKRLVLQAVDAPVVVSRVGLAQDFFIELTNTSNYDVDMSLWQIGVGTQEFLIPKNTFLSKKQKIIFSPKITGIVYENKQDVILKNQNKDIVFLYIPHISTSSQNKPNKIASIAKKQPGSMTAMVGENEGAYVDLSNQVLLAQADKPALNSNKSTLVYTILLGVVGVACVLVLRLRKNQRKEELDFEIVDE